MALPPLCAANTLRTRLVCLPAHLLHAIGASALLIGLKASNLVLQSRH